MILSFLDSLFIVSKIVSNDAKRVALVLPNSSKAPALIKLSMHLLFIDSPFTLSQKLVKLS